MEVGMATIFVKKVIDFSPVFSWNTKLVYAYAVLEYQTTDFVCFF
jgi:hypothetical protein